MNAFGLEDKNRGHTLAKRFAPFGMRCKVAQDQKQADLSPDTGLGASGTFGPRHTVHAHGARVLFLARGTPQAMRRRWHKSGCSRAAPNAKVRAIMALSQITAAGAYQMAHMCGRQFTPPVPCAALPYAATTQNGMTRMFRSVLWTISDRDEAVTVLAQQKKNYCTPLT